jgi:CrcB protein
MRLLTIAVGGAAGALCRYFVTGWVQGLATGPFPVGTLFVNFTGCFVFGVLAAIFAGTAPASDPYRVLLLVGFLGAYTTFSTFSWDTLALFDDGRLDLALLNVGASNLLCLTGVWLGHRLAS